MSEPIVWHASVIDVGGILLTVLVYWIVSRVSMALVNSDHDPV